MNLRATQCGYYTLGLSESDTLISAVLSNWLWISYPLLAIALKLRGKISLKMAVNQSWWLIKAKIHHACVQHRLLLRWLKSQMIFGVELSKPLSGFT
jgi:hypothetical protein